MKSDHTWMQEALALAQKGLYTTYPNPSVGCLIVKDGQCVGKGYHVAAGTAHAEQIALQMAAEQAVGATCYVTLAPCAHHGQTPPCAHALVNAKIARVVLATTDRNPIAQGGAAYLRAHGVLVEEGICEGEARALNAGFFSWHERKKPWVRLKVAMSADGHVALANGESQWITQEGARADAHTFRARSQAIVTGIGTVLKDDPRLSVRLPEYTGPQPTKVVIDTQGRLPDTAALLNEAAPVLWFTAQAVTTSKPNVRVIQVPEKLGRIDLSAVFDILQEFSFHDILVEAGPTLTGAVLANNLADELLLYVAPMFLGEGAQSVATLPALTALQEAKRFAWHDVKLIGSDVRLMAHLQKEEECLQVL